jgi:hypothetical protein
MRAKANGAYFNPIQCASVYKSDAVCISEKGKGKVLSNLNYFNNEKFNIINSI